ncbi:efflux RND transporter periplasmic adaptor subunit [Salinibacter altiplanensis]|uniref:efflux RND transporter periplasmic adaptor subunit n=1 Tax=Salinibacter altiplanensis TaxID=1803181 RepID=UPI000C9ECD62|nr:HlyD family efflux transporter periplasmic adaptor subunit [Salinibacter altiplanensis]
MVPQDSTPTHGASSDESSPSTSALIDGGPHSSGGTGEGIDRKIETSLFTPRRIGIGVAVVLALGTLAYGVWTTATGGQVYNVDRDKVTVSTVQQDDFQEFITVTGTAVPEQTVYLGAVEGGRVEEIYLEEGKMVEEGEPILRLSNNDLRLQLARTEARLSEQRSRMQQIRMDMEQRRLGLQRDLAQIRNQVRQLERQHRRQKQLHEQDLIADQQFEQTRDDLEYQRQRLALTRSAYRQDSLTYQTRLDQQRSQQQRLDDRYETMQEAVQSLTVQAPIDGQVTSLNAELGQIIGAGTRVGQVDKIGRYELRAQIDEFYIERVRHGQTATTDALGDTTHTLTIDRVYPEVESGQFEVDLAFQGDSPPAVRRGQTVRLKLELGQPKAATLLARGGFYQSTGGSWAYVLTENGDAAVRRSLRLGRQNPNHFEVLDGLKPGDRVITSSYDSFGDADRLSLE